MPAPYNHSSEYDYEVYEKEDPRSLINNVYTDGSRLERIPRPIRRVAQNAAIQGRTALSGTFRFPGSQGLINPNQSRRTMRGSAASGVPMSNSSELPQDRQETSGRSSLATGDWDQKASTQGLTLTPGNFLAESYMSRYPHGRQRYPLISSADPNGPTGSCSSCSAVFKGRSCSMRLKSGTDTCTRCQVKGWTCSRLTYQ